MKLASLAGGGAALWLALLSNCDGNVLLGDEDSVTKDAGGADSADATGACLPFLVFACLPTTLPESGSEAGTGQEAGGGVAEAGSPRPIGGEGDDAGNSTDGSVGAGDAMGGNVDAADGETPCSASATSAGGCPCFCPPSTASLLTPSVSFVKDVMPIFAMSCAFSGCHIQIDMKGMLPLFLYTEDHTTPAAMLAPEVYGELVNQPSTEDPTMPYVTPGDPRNSFLQRKIDGDLCDIASQCPATNAVYRDYQSTYPSNPQCGASMPEQLPLLDQGPRDTIRRWIAQGAQNN